MPRWGAPARPKQGDRVRARARRTGSTMKKLHDYEEARILFEYVWQHCQHLMTEVERRADHAALARSKAVGSRSRGNSEAARIILERWGAIGDLAVESELSDGFDAFRERVFCRLLADPRCQELINRCPRCQRPDSGDAKGQAMSLVQARLARGERRTRTCTRPATRSKVVRVPGRPRVRRLLSGSVACAPPAEGRHGAEGEKKLDGRLRRSAPLRS
jgi:hypothetical protein